MLTTGSERLPRRIAATLIALSLSSATADTPPPRHTIQVSISAECMSSFFPPIIGVARHKFVAWDPSHAKPFAFHDPRTSLTLYVESDGRHVAAIDSAGTLLWVRDPFQDAGLCPYRTPRPVIYEITEDELHPSDLTAVHADLKHKFGMVTFDSSQFGLIDETNGRFIYLGQN